MDTILWYSAMVMRIHAMFFVGTKSFLTIVVGICTLSGIYYHMHVRVLHDHEVEYKDDVTTFF